MITNLQSLDYASILSGDGMTKARFQDLVSQLITVSSIIEGSGVPSFPAAKHQQYFNTATSKYYRNTDGGTTWVALN